MIKKVFLALEDTDIDNENNKWNLAKDWVINNETACKQIKALAFARDNYKHKRIFLIRLNYILC